MPGYPGPARSGYPAPPGTRAAAPGRPVMAATGDGGPGQYAAELTTAVSYGIGTSHVLPGNGPPARSATSSPRPASRSGTPRRVTPTGPPTPDPAARPASPLITATSPARA